MPRSEREALADEQVENWISVGCSPGECLATLRANGRLNWASVWLEVWKRTDAGRDEVQRRAAA